MARGTGNAPFAALVIFLASCAGVPHTAIEIPGGGLGDWNGTDIVATRFGILQGKRDRLGTFAWLGIPYAAPPVGDFRWQVPRPPAAWKGVRDAVDFGNWPVQQLPVIGDAFGSEDCLYLNIWRPATAESGLPVHVWIHGGDNSVGSSDINPDFHGQPLASKANIVFVSINYRLGIFGWFSHPSLRTGDPENDSGNFGTLDIIAALEWLRDNVAAFGGDPGNVTVTGESSGALNVLTLLIAPKARGLFSKAAAESPYRPTATIAEAEQFSEDIIRRFLVRRHIAKNEREAALLLAAMPKKEIARLLRAADSMELLSLVKPGKVGIRSFPYPFFDGTVLPSDGFFALADPARSATVPLVIGTTKEEAKVFQWFDGQPYRDPFYQVRAELASQRWRSENSDSIADAFASASSDRQVYVYRFDWGAPNAQGESVLGGSAGARFGASHGLDMSFFLQTDTVYGNIFPFPLFTKRNEQGRKDLKARMGLYIRNFLHSGNPNEGEAREDGVNNGGISDLPFWEIWRFDTLLPTFVVFDAGFDEAKIHLEQGRVDPEFSFHRIEAE